jgi:hypothetical protein
MFRLTYRNINETANASAFDVAIHMNGITCGTIKAAIGQTDAQAQSANLRSDR